MRTETSTCYRIMLTIFLLTGMALRLWHWSDQMFLDDEWHAFGFVMNRTFFEVLFQHGMGANSIPVNIWFWLTLHTVGWSETVLRFPSMAAAFLALLFLPLLVKRLWGPTVSLVFAALIAVSPILIFYSRIDRPFAPAMLFGTASLLLTLQWMRDGEQKQLLLSVICGFIGIYYHLYTAIPVGSTLIVAAVASFSPLSRHLGLSVHSCRPWPALWSSAGILSALLALFVVLPNVLNPWWMGVQGMSRANWGTLKTFVEFIAGSARFGLSYSMYLLVPLGAALLIRRDRTQGIALITPLVIFFTVIANYTQDGAQAGIQAARYGIVIFPICFITIAIALEWLVNRLRDILPGMKSRPFAPAALFLLWLPFLAASPLWSIYRFPNNFTNHSGYQYSYSPISWELSPERALAPGISLRYEEIPVVYRQPQLHAGCKGIIEYPMAIGDHFNLLFYYQHFHRLPVVAGYTRHDLKPTDPPRGEWIYANNTIDYVMTRVPQHLVHKTARWNTMVDLEQMKQIRRDYAGWLIVLHKNPIREVTEHIPEFGQVWSKSPDLPEAAITANFLFSSLGPPIMESNHTMAWIIR